MLLINVCLMSVVLIVSYENTRMQVAGDCSRLHQPAAVLDWSQGGNLHNDIITTFPLAKHLASPFEHCHWLTYIC